MSSNVRRGENLSMKKKHNPYKLSKKHLDKGQIDYYKNVIGEPDLSQNWLELFTPTIIHDLFEIMNSCSDNQQKSDYVTELLEPYGFRDLGIGTNITVMVNPVYPGVVFKIALDENGIADNFNDCVLQNAIPHYVKVLARHPSSIVSVQERHIVMDLEHLPLYKDSILRLLKQLKDYYLIIDLAPTERLFLNYGIGRDGDFVILDGSDLYPLSQMKEHPSCKRVVGEHKKTGEFKYCEGKLKYTPEFEEFVCEKCGRRSNPILSRPKKDASPIINLMMDSSTAQDRERYFQEDCAAIMKRNHNDDDHEMNANSVSNRTIFVEPDSINNAEDIHKEYTEYQQSLNESKLSKPNVGETPNEDDTSYDSNDNGSDEYIQYVQCNEQPCMSWEEFVGISKADDDENEEEDSETKPNVGESDNEFDDLCVRLKELGYHQNTKGRWIDSKGHFVNTSRLAEAGSACQTESMIGSYEEQSTENVKLLTIKEKELYQENDIILYGAKIGEREVEPER